MPTGRAAWLKPRRLQVQLLSWARPGRQSADHLGLEPHDAAGSIPAWAIGKRLVLVEQSGVLACLSRRRSRVQIPPGTLGTITARYANRKSGQRPCCARCPNLGDLRVRLPPALLGNYATIGHWQAQLAVTQPSLEDLQVQLLLVALSMARSSIGIGRQTLDLARRVRFPHGLLKYGQVAQLADARRSGRRARAPTERPTVKTSASRPGERWFDSIRDHCGERICRCSGSTRPW